MVYKIRNKSFFWTKTGWKNNYFPKSFNMPRPSASESTLAIRCRYDHHSFLRGIKALISFEISDFSQLTKPIETSPDTVSNTSMVISNLKYNINKIKNDNKNLKEIFILGIRSFFLIPQVSETPTDLIKHGGVRDNYQRIVNVNI